MAREEDGFDEINNTAKLNLDIEVPGREDITNLVDRINNSENNRIIVDFLCVKKINVPTNDLIGMLKEVNQEKAVVFLLPRENTGYKFQLNLALKQAGVKGKFASDIETAYLHLENLLDYNSALSKDNKKSLNNNDQLES
jgi:hypothetical protein